MSQTAIKNQLSRVLHCAAAWCLVFSLLVCSVPLATAQKKGDQNLGGTPLFIVQNLNDNGTGSFREAINAANAAGSGDIRFAVTGTINLETPLPAITVPVIINLNTPSNMPTPDTPTIELNGQATQIAGNASIGLWIRSGNSTIKGLAINRFGEAGIRMDTDGNGNDNGNIIISSHIGTNVAGDTALPNINRGILIVGTTGHRIGGAAGFEGAPGDRNVISGNLGRGIEISAGGSANITGNYIGTNAAGNGDLGNTSDGVQIVNSSGSTIGYYASLGTPGNVISGNNGHGVSILTDFNFTASNNLVAGNVIGTNAAGTAALGNNGSGVVIQASNNTVGGVTAQLRNVISGNRVNGVSLGTTFATGNTIAGNFIGTGLNGTSAIPNRDNGVQIANTAAGNIIGGAGVTPGSCDNSCNVIANNGDANSLSARAGVYVDITAGASNTIQGNSIFNNGGIGIDLGAPGTTANDANDPDTGPNNSQNFPVITSALTSGNVTGTLNSTPNTNFRIDFYRNTAADGANSEGRTYIGSTNTATDGSGNATFGFTSTPTLAAGQYITATATTTGGAAQAVGDTSEFSGQALVTETGGGFTIEGRVTYGVPANNPQKPVPDVLVTATGPTTESDTTDQTGEYQLNNLVPGGSYTVTPSKTGGVNGAITAFDATVVLRCVAAGANCELTGNQPQAADTDNDGSTTAFDATLILRYVAANGPTNNTGQTGTWEFIPPQRTYSPLTGNQTGQDYVAVLVGDVDGDWMPSSPPQTKQRAKIEADNQQQEKAIARNVRLSLSGFFSPRRITLF
ncbi:MAG: dockerin type I domain-containing protein [Acidobacteriota bacterium]|nr:dockerin type I domain-containing protein [Acidobacteriota bacterium]